MKATYRATIARGGTFDSDDPLGDQIQEFEESLGLAHDSSDFALEQMKLWYKVTGREWDETPVNEGMVVTRSGELTKTQNVGMADINVEYTNMADLNKKLAKPGR